MRVELVSRKMQVNAVGEYTPESGELIVLKGSIVSLSLSESKTFRGRKSIEKAREDTIEGNAVIKDITFKSPSTAANYVTGGSSNGMRLWKTEEGIPIGDLQKREV